MSQQQPQSHPLSDENVLSAFLLDLFIKIHNKLGPGLLESIYEEVICYELTRNNIPFKRQQPMSVVYEEIKLNAGFRADLIIANKVIVEIKSVDSINAVHFKQLLTYLKLSDKKLGILVNFNADLIKNGFHRVVNNLQLTLQ